MIRSHRTLRVFLSGSWAYRAGLAEASQWLFTQPTVTVVSTWHQPTDSPLTGAQAARRDLEDLERADALLLDTRYPSHGGTGVELGLALAWGMPWVRVGPVTTVYHELTPWAYEDWEALRAGWSELEAALRADRVQEVFQLQREFAKRLHATSADGQRKRAAGLKVPWWTDPGHAEALDRHLDRWRLGQRRDLDSGQHPLVHAAWRALALAYQETQGPTDPGPGPVVVEGGRRCVDG